MKPGGSIYPTRRQPLITRLLNTYEASLQRRCRHSMPAVSHHLTHFLTAGSFWILTH